MRDGRMKILFDGSRIFAGPKCFNKNVLFDATLLAGRDVAKNIPRSSRRPCVRSKWLLRIAKDLRMTEDPDRQIGNRSRRCRDSWKSNLSGNLCPELLPKVGGQPLGDLLNAKDLRIAAYLTAQPMVVIE